MCYYIETHTLCGHNDKLPFDTTDCTCELKNPKMKKNDPVNATLDDPEETGNVSGKPESKKYHRKYGMFQGELQAVKESWCSKCLVTQKAQLYDQVTGGNLGSVLSKAINPGEPQIHPTKTHTKKPTSPTQIAEEENMAVDEVAYMVPKWGTQWEDKTRNDMKWEIREGKMAMVDEIKALRAVAKTCGKATTEIEQKIKAQTDERKAAEHKQKVDADKKRQERIAKNADDIYKAQAVKLEKKLAIQAKKVWSIVQRA